MAWGRNDSGQTNVPGSASGSTVAIAGGGYHSLALTMDRTVVAWGAGQTSSGVAPEYGQSQVPPSVASYGSEALAVAAGRYHSLARKASGELVAWGAGKTNSGVSPHFGQSLVPAGISNIAAIAAGAFHSLVLLDNGNVIAWGDNSHGQTNVPTGLANVVAIAAGTFHNLALKNNGTVVAWGDNSRGQTNVPTGLSNVVAVAAGDYHSLALAAPPPPGGVYDFEDNTFQGWEPFFIFNGIAHLATGTGDTPGNCLATDDTTPGGASLYYRAPPAFSGDLSAWAGVAWDEYLPPEDPGGNTTLFLIAAGSHDVWQNNNEPVGGYGRWNARLATFNPDNWTCLLGTNSFDTALSNVQQIELRVEVTGMIMAEASIDNIRLVPQQPPFIVQQPEAYVVVPVGSSTTFTVIAGGDEPLEHQWQFEGVDISGETLPELALYDVQPTNAGHYRVVVTNVWGSVTSSVATLIVTGVATNYTVSLGPGYFLIANQLDNGGNTLAEIMPSVPPRTVLYKSSTGAFPMDQRAVSRTAGGIIPGSRSVPAKALFYTRRRHARSRSRVW